jgi:biotin carboxyl carrier protein
MDDSHLLQVINAQDSSEHNININYTYYSDWLISHQNLIEGLESAMVQVSVDGTLVQAASLNEGSEFYAALFNIVEHQASIEQPQVISLKTFTTSEVFGLLNPVRDDCNNLIALITMAVNVKSQNDLQSALELVRLSVAAIEVVDYQQRLSILSQQQQCMAERLEILARVLAEPEYESAAVRLVTELAVLFNCDRVSLGEYKKQRSRLKHLSHSTEFGKKMNLVRCIEQAMDECIDQGQNIRYPQLDINSSEVVLAHKKLSEQQGDACVLSIPIYFESKAHGAVILEGNPDVPFAEEQAELCQSIVSLVMPCLEDKRLNNRSLWRKALDSLSNQLAKVFGPGYLGRKLFLLIALALFFILDNASGLYRLSTEARIDSAIQRAIVAPYDGYIETATARAGDSVKKGQALVSLYDRDLRLENLKWLSEQAKLNRQYQEALATHDRAEINIINAQQAQVDTQLKLVANKLERALLTAPFDGLVVSGDLSQRLGSSVSKGEELLAVSPLHQYRINMLVKENRISDVELGQTGSLYLSALPEERFDFKVAKITPLTEAKNGATYFIIEGEIESDVNQLQRGMEGIGKINIDERRLVSIWSRGSLEWLRLKLWSWWS